MESSVFCFFCTLFFAVVSLSYNVIKRYKEMLTRQPSVFLAVIVFRISCGRAQFLLNIS